MYTEGQTNETYCLFAGELNRKNLESLQFLSILVWKIDSTSSSSTYIHPNIDFEFLAKRLKVQSSSIYLKIEAPLTCKLCNYFFLNRLHVILSDYNFNCANSTYEFLRRISIDLNKIGRIYKFFLIQDEQIQKRTRYQCRVLSKLVWLG